MLWGQGEMHLRVAMNKLQKIYNIQITEEKLRFSFRETIMGSVTDHETTHKKQSGGAGQYAKSCNRCKNLCQEVKILNLKIRLLEALYLETYIPSVEKGCKEYMSKGPLGFPVADVHIILKDGKTHDVDSNSNSFHIAGIKALRETLLDCKPVLLEPFYKVKFSVPSMYINNIYTLVTSKRGVCTKIIKPKDGWKDF